MIGFVILGVIAFLFAFVGVYLLFKTVIREYKQGDHVAAFAASIICFVIVSCIYITGYGLYREYIVTC